MLDHVSFDGRVLRLGRKRYDLAAFDRIQVIGAGKAGAAMAHAIEKLLGRRISGGLVNVPDGGAAPLRRIQLHPCGHPIPDERGVEGARRILEIAHAAGPRDLLIALISGGASAMLPAPAPPLMREARTGSDRPFNLAEPHEGFAEPDSVVRARSLEARTGSDRPFNLLETREGLAEPDSVVRARSLEARTGSARPFNLVETREGFAEPDSVVRARSLKDKQELTRQLLASGATIHEINTVRKHLSLIKGGQLAQAAFPATVIALLLSDVVGDDPGVIGSGPTVPDPSTVADAVAVLKKYGLDDPRIVETLALHETPKPGDPVFARSHHVIVGSNKQAIAAAEACARSLGYRTMVLSTTIEGEAREIARMHAAIAREILASNRPLRRPACLLSGGETTVTLRGRGKGGRNQEFVLAAILALEKLEPGPGPSPS